MGKHNLFKVRVNVTLSDLKDQLDQINGRLNHRGKKRVDIVEYHRLLVDSGGSVWFIHMKLYNKDDVRTMFSIFGRHSLKGSVELDASLVRSELA
ncbi:hypothetical protein MtrunA17_Chr4g0024521 [Medicago truncatula]|uniref:40S ribosomal S10-like protein n=1 Tax=Medicago truncatula TaxID=3880 RepID=G7JDI3_MEDTR|nr:hypothetical protein MTR_4g048050 [Medicago truncatula]RHN60321.1 hypothetical protein MtrunA17_Chr4g0024521 [Medicago truncatula]